MKRTTCLMLAAAVTMAALPEASEAKKRYVAHATVSGPAAVRVWVEGGDVFPDYDHVTLWVRAERDCYTSLFLVDTAGYVHVLNAGDGWMHGGRNYSYRARDLGLGRLDGRGIAYVFAVGSPAPFDYSYYGDAVRVGGFGYRVVGDPFVASREFYMSLLPATCRWDYVGVHYTRFYVREWTRYPSYLCLGGPGLHVRVGDSCRGCAHVYTAYRCNVAAPHDVIRPHVRYKDTRYSTQVRHVVRSADHQARRDSYSRPASDTPVVTKNVRRIKSFEGTRVVSTSGQLAREPQFVKTPRAADTRDDAVLIAANGHGKSKSASLAQESREKGARKKARQAK